MKYSLSFLVLFVSLKSFSIEKSQIISEPPNIYSKQQIQVWVEEELRKVNPSLEVKLLTSQEWSDYVNYSHFVPLTLEGVPEGYVFNYNWDPNLSKEERNAKVKLPTAEVTEEGRFIMWWNRCNFYEMTEAECKEFIKLAVAHEAHHYDQWLRVSQRTIEQLGLRIETPRNLDEIRSINGAESVFMSRWADGAHYQCREVEVYSEQMLSGEMPIDMPGRLKKLENYYNGCSKSPHTQEFSKFLQQIKKLMQENSSLLK